MKFIYGPTLFTLCTLFNTVPCNAIEIGPKKIITGCVVLVGSGIAIGSVATIKVKGLWSDLLGNREREAAANARHQEAQASADARHQEAQEAADARQNALLINNKELHQETQNVVTNEGEATRSTVIDNGIILQKQNKALGEMILVLYNEQRASRKTLIEHVASRYVTSEVFETVQTMPLQIQIRTRTPQKPAICCCDEITIKAYGSLQKLSLKNHVENGLVRARKFLWKGDDSEAQN